MISRAEYLFTVEVARLVSIKTIPHLFSLLLVRQDVPIDRGNLSGLTLREQCRDDTKDKHASIFEW